MTFWSVLRLYSSLNALHLSKASNKKALDVSLLFSYIFLSSDLLPRLVLEEFIPEQDVPESAITPCNTTVETFSGRACFHYAIGLETCYDCNMRSLLTTCSSHIRKRDCNLPLSVTLQTQRPILNQTDKEI